jgi:hypothetical protein
MKTIVNGYRHSAPPPSTEFITSSPSTALRSDFTGCVGFNFTVGASSITVTDLGRWVVSGNSLSHTVKIVDTSGTIIVSASINTAGQPVGFTYTSIAPTVLIAATTYIILSEETSPGDEWYEVGPVTHVGGGIATINGGSYQLACSGAPAIVFPGTDSYVTVNFKYY